MRGGLGPLIGLAGLGGLSALVGLGGLAVDGDLWNPWGPMEPNGAQWAAMWPQCGAKEPHWAPWGDMGINGSQIDPNWAPLGFIGALWAPTCFTFASYQSHGMRAERGFLQGRTFNRAQRSYVHPQLRLPVPTFDLKALYLTDHVTIKKNKTKNIHPHAPAEPPRWRVIIKTEHSQRWPRYECLPT